MESRVIDIGYEEKADGALVVTPRFKRLDALIASEFRDAVGARLANHKTVVLALGSVGFVDSSGLASLISLLKRMPAGAQLRLCEVASPVQHLLTVTRLEKIFPVHPDVASALKA
jgi:anti-sigma B factor antagonist